MCVQVRVCFLVWSCARLCCASSLGAGWDGTGFSVHTSAEGRSVSFVRSRCENAVGSRDTGCDAEASRDAYCNMTSYPAGNMTCRREDWLGGRFGRPGLTRSVRALAERCGGCVLGSAGHGRHESDARRFRLPPHPSSSRTPDGLSLLLIQSSTGHAPS